MDVEGGAEWNLEADDGTQEQDALRRVLQMTAERHQSAQAHVQYQAALQEFLEPSKKGLQLPEPVEDQHDEMDWESTSSDDEGDHDA